MNRLWHDARTLNALATAIFAGVALALVASAVSWLVHRPAFTLRAIEVVPAPGHPLRHVSEQALLAAQVRRVDGNFFTVDLAAVRVAFEKAPWVRRATVRRVWPDRLEVDIEEHRPAAVWRVLGRAADGAAEQDDARLLNTHDEVFTANVAEAEADGRLPVMAGPEGSEREVARRWRELGELLSPLPARPVQLELSPRAAWTARLDNGVTLVMGREQDVPVMARVARFVETWPQMAARIGARSGTVDLRYPNGFAIRVADASPRAGARTPPSAKEKR